MKTRQTNTTNRTRRVRNLGVSSFIFQAVLLLGFMLFVASCETQEDEFVEMNGRIMLNDKPFEGVTIKCGCSTLKSDSLGRFAFVSANNTIYRLQAYYSDKVIVDTLVLVSPDNANVNLVYKRQEPVAVLAVSPQRGDVNTTFELNAQNSYDPKGLGELSYRWNTGDGFGAWTTSAAQQHKFSDAGTKQLLLEVRDKEGLIRRVAQSLQVVNL